MKQPLFIHILKSLAKREARGTDTGRYSFGAVSIHYYPVSCTYNLWLGGVKVSQGQLVRQLMEEI